jgi:HK97 family phage major capsid protein
MAALIRLSNEVAEDAVISVADWIVGEIAYAFASKEDDAGFNGDGSSTYGGIQGLSTQFATNTKGVYTATGHLTADALTAGDLSLLMALLPQYALKNSAFICSQYSFAACFMRLKAAGGGNTLGDLANAVPYQYLGRPIVISQKLPSTSPTGTLAIYYGDLSLAAAFGEKREVTIKRSDDASANI